MSMVNFNSNLNLVTSKCIEVMMAHRSLFFCFKNVQGVLHSNILSATIPKILGKSSLKINSSLYTKLVNYTSNSNTPSTVSNLETLRENVDLTEFKRLNFIGTKYVVQTLQKLLSVTPTDAKIIIRDYPKLRRIPTEIIEENYNLYRKEEISKDVIKRYPNILSLRDSNFRLSILKQLPISLNSSAPLLLTSIAVLKRTVRDAIEEKDIVPYGNRIVHLSKTLNIPEEEISDKLVKHHYILRIPIKRLDRVLKILLNYGVEPKNIMSDFWSLRYSPELAEKRLQRALNANVEKVKAWMIRCPDSVFDRCINRQVENRKILGSDSSVEEYLSKRLECTIDNAKYLTEKYPALEKMNSSKMKEIMDYLFQQGYTPGHICRVPRILIHSLETTKSRLLQLRQLGYVPPSLAILCKSKRDYDKYIIKYNKKKLPDDKET